MAGVGACSPRRPPGIFALFHSRESAAGSNDAQPPPISFVARLRHVQALKSAEERAAHPRIPSQSSDVWV